MKLESKLAMIVAYYLSRHNREALSALGYQSFRTAFEDIGRKLGVKPNTIKNARDDFDPLHETGRVGWYQRSLRPSRASIATTFNEVSESALRSIVKDILCKPEFRTSSSMNQMLKTLSSEENKRDAEPVFVPRGITGRKAEEIFVTYFGEGKTSFQGTLKDMRDAGVGYDFSVSAPSGELFVEIKGLAADNGAVAFTAKEWEKAQEWGEKYYLVIVSGIGTSPKLELIKNPAAKFSPSRHISTAVIISWQISTSQIASLKRK